jgi:hypothetical protein
MKRLDREIDHTPFYVAVPLAAELNSTAVYFGGIPPMRYNRRRLIPSRG